MLTLGIRHHGPGSARRLTEALESYRPELILLEMPADSQAALQEVTAKEMRPPLALVLYEAKNIERASFFPFARFSPEYQALLWAEENDVEVRPIDLPARHFLAHEVEQQQIELFAPPSDPEAGAPSEIPGKSRGQLVEQLRRDPLSLVAELAGYADSESWWDATLERGGGDGLEVFSAVSKIVRELREAFPEASNEENDRREAYMRTEIRKLRKQGPQRVAVVVGAFHGPAVASVDSFTIKGDRALLKGLPRTKVSAAWVPWSFPRLARSSGYGAGVISPAWYAALFDHGRGATSRYMTAAAQLLRGEGFDASPAMATEAVSLAGTLATLREHEYPGVAELEEATLVTLAEGRPERLALIRERLTIGREVGFVPPGVTTVPLLEDLQAELRGTRMGKLWEMAGEHYLKATKNNPRGGIDLRQPNDLRKSHLLHRLNLLGIKWGRLQDANPESISSFKEVWLLEWQPEFSLTLIGRGSYGNTVAAAAASYLGERAADITDVTTLATLTLDALRANLPATIPTLMQLLRRRAAATTDVTALLAALPALVETSRYGDSRRTDTTALLLVIDEILPRITAGLPAAAGGIDDEQALQLVGLLAAANYQLGRLENDDLTEQWLDGLQRTAAAPAAQPAVEGHCIRLLYDHGRMGPGVAATRFARALSRGRGAAAVAAWIEGFLHGGGQLLLHHPELFGLVDDWVAKLSWEEFEGVVAQLRRSFASFSGYERRKLWERVGVAEGAQNAANRQQSGSGSEVGEELVKELLGWMGG